MNGSQTAYKAREQLGRFLGIFSPHFSLPEQKFLGDMFYGLQASQDVKLSNIGRALDEPIALKKTEERLSRNLKREGIAETVSDCVAREGAKRIKRDTLIVIDPTDIQKLYARRMPYLGRVRDGSTGQLGNGYWACAAVGVQSGGRRIIPLHLRLWSCSAPGFVSENEEIAQVVDTIRAGTRKRGIYVIDRGGDRENIYKIFMRNDLRFIVRMVGNRDLLWGKRTLLAEKLAAKCRMRYSETIRRETGSGEKTYQIEYGSMSVRLPQWPDRSLHMVVVKGFGQKPMMLLTNLDLTQSRASLWQVVEGYLSRWRVEDAIRYIKQSYNIEDIRLLDYTRLRNMLAIVLAAVFFASVWLGESLRRGILVGNITRASKRLFGVVEFHYYAIADGLATLFKRYGSWNRSNTQPTPSTSSPQMDLGLYAPG